MSPLTAGIAAFRSCSHCPRSPPAPPGAARPPSGSSQPLPPGSGDSNWLRCAPPPTRCAHTVSRYALEDVAIAGAGADCAGRGPADCGHAANAFEPSSGSDSSSQTNLHPYSAMDERAH